MATRLPVIRTRRLEIRLAAPDDLALVLDYMKRNRAFLKPWEPLKPKGFYTKRFWQEQIAHNVDDFFHDRSLRMFAFPRSKPRRVVATVNFSNFVRGVAHMCHLGYSLDGRLQGTGLMTEALQAAVPWVFEKLGMHRVMANYMPRNLKSGAVLRRLGFTVEGYAKDYLLIAGKWEDHILTSLVNPGWRQPV